MMIDVDLLVNGDLIVEDGLRLVKGRLVYVCDEERTIFFFNENFKQVAIDIRKLNEKEKSYLKADIKALMNDPKNSIDFTRYRVNVFATLSQKYASVKDF